MRIAVFLDSSILLELLDVPGKSQNRAEVMAALEQRVEAGETLLLPTAAIIETGNHIAQLPNGSDRRRCAEGLRKFLDATANDAPPWVLNGARWDTAFIRSVCNGTTERPSLVEMATRKIGAGDVSILAEAEAYGSRVARVIVEVWTLDAGLAAYA